jgi:serine/threonine protein kinase
MKPENVLLTAEGHILMTDFGISKGAPLFFCPHCFFMFLSFAEGLDNNSMRTATFCGTPEYLAPEVLLGQGYGKAVDWWCVFFSLFIFFFFIVFRSYGSVCYEMLTGLPPYYSEDITEMYKKILQVGKRIFFKRNPFADSMFRLRWKFLQNATRLLETF